MNFDCFSHGQITSKVWLCNEVEKYLHDNSKIAILGGWYNLLGFMLLTRFSSKISKLTSFDIDVNTKSIADKITDTWLHKIVTNVIADVNTVDLNDYNVVINCSPEHMYENHWFKNIKKETIVCIQSSNITIQTDPWLVVNPNVSLKNLCNKYTLSNLLYADELPIVYDNWGYKRYMIIGKK